MELVSLNKVEPVVSQTCDYRSLGVKFLGVFPDKKSYQLMEHFYLICTRRTTWMTSSLRMEFYRRTLLKGVGPYSVLLSWTTTTPLITTEVSSHHI